MPRIDEPLTNMDTRNAQTIAKDRFNEAMAAAEQASSRPAQGSLAAKRKDAARKFALTLLRDIAHHPTWRGGAITTAAEVSALIADEIEAAGVPASLRADVKAAAERIAERAVGGNFGEADAMAREEAVSLGAAVARSAWRGDSAADSDGFDPRAIAANIRRNG